MTSTPTKQHLEEAMHWLLLLNQRQADGELRDQHKAWLASDPLHAVAWRQASKGWTMLGKTEPATMSRWPKQPARTAPGKLLAFPIRRRSPAAWMAVAAACLALVLVPLLGQSIGADYSTSTAEIRHITLLDGSTIQLAPDSALSAHLTSENRAIKLSNGRAYFVVAKDEARPFVVQAGNVSITALGTAFDVRVNDRTVLVAVSHGRVGVRQANKQLGAGRVDEYLIPGNQLSINRATGELVAERVPEDAVGDWAEGQLSALNAPVSEIVAEIRRYHRGWIIIADDRLGAERVTGLYNLNTPDQALAALLQPIGGNMRRISPFLTILSKSEK